MYRIRKHARGYEGYLQEDGKWIQKVYESNGDYKWVRDWLAFLQSEFDDFSQWKTTRDK